MQDYLILMCNDSMNLFLDFLIRFNLKFPDNCKIMVCLPASKNQRYLSIFHNQMCHNTPDSQKFLSTSDSWKSRSFQGNQRSLNTRDSQISHSTQGSQTCHNILVNQKFLNNLVNTIYQAVKSILQDSLDLTRVVPPWPLTCLQVQTQ